MVDFIWVDLVKDWSAQSWSRISWFRQKLISWHRINYLATKTPVMQSMYKITLWDYTFQAHMQHVSTTRLDTYGSDSTLSVPIHRSGI